MQSEWECGLESKFLAKVKMTSLDYWRFCKMIFWTLRIQTRHVEQLKVQVFTRLNRLCLGCWKGGLVLVIMISQPKFARIQF